MLSQISNTALQLTKNFLANKPASPLLIILGPTASGKTGLAIKIAEELDGAIISADSRAIYRKLDIGTAKPTATEMATIPHYLISEFSPDQTISTAKYRELAEEKIEDILKRGKLPILAGSHTLLISAIVENYQFPMGAEANPEKRASLESEYAKPAGPTKLWQRLNELDPVASKKIPAENKHHLIRALELIEQSETILNESKVNEGSTKINISNLKKKSPRKYEALLLGLNPDREKLYARINTRVDKMMAAGLLTEVKSLAKKYNRDLPALRGHGYRELLDYLNGEKTLKTAVEEIKKNTRNYAKRQQTWWRNCVFSSEIQWLS